MSTADLYDLIVVVIIVISAILGYQKGLINQIGAIISMIVGIIVSIRFTPMLAEYLPGSDNVKFVSALIILLFAATLIVWGLVNLISHIITNLKLNYWNNQMGALLGVVYGLLWTITLTFILLVFAVPAPVSKTFVDKDGNPVELKEFTEKSFIMESKTGPYLTYAALAIIDNLPQGGDYKIYDYLREYLRQNANSIKKNNPDLPNETFHLSAPGESSPDDEKPQLPAILPSSNL